MIAYIHQVREDAHPGVAQKIAMQIETLELSGQSVEEVYLSESKIVFHKLSRQLPFMPDGYGWDRVEPGKYSVLYIRRPAFISASFVSFLRKLKSLNPRVLVLLELPTYPYDAEMSGLRMRNLLIKDRINRRRLVDLVDRVIDLTGEQEIFGIKTLQIRNGIDCDSVSPREPSHDGTTINVACAAAFSPWHGVDRVIEGMKEYVAQGGQAKIHFHLMGEGPELPSLKSLVSEYNLDGYFTFYGQCNREQMDRVYNQCTISLASLGMHRIGLQVASTLKTREYLAKGMPFIYAGEIDVFLENPVDFCLRVPADDNPINIKQLVEFHNELYAGKEEHVLIDRIRQYAIENVSMEKAMANVVGYIKEHSCE